MSNKARLCSQEIKIETPKEIRTIFNDIFICKISAGENNSVKTKRNVRILNYSNSTVDLIIDHNI